MSGLHELQQAFAEGLIDGNHLAVEAAITPGDTALRSLGLYRRLIRTNYTQVLSVTFPVLRRLVGPRYFDTLARGYLKRHPSRSGDLFPYGRHLPAMLDQLQVARLLIELARLEWACHEVYQASDSPWLPRDQFDAALCTDPSAVTFRLNPTARLLRGSLPVHRVWLALQPDAPTGIVVDLPLPDDETGIVVTKAEGKIHVAALPPLDYRLLETMAERQTVTEVEQIARETDPDFDFTRFMASVLGLNLLAGVSLGVDS